MIMCTAGSQLFQTVKPVQHTDP